MTVGSDGDEIGKWLGQAIRARRKVRELTLVQLAEQTGLSNPFLSQVERGAAFPSMTSLHRIARALGATAPELLSAGRPGEELPDICLTRANEGHIRQHRIGSTRALVRGVRSMYPVEFLVTSEEYEDYYEHEGAECIYVLSGRLVVDLDTEGTYELLTGDTLYYSGGIRHRWRLANRWPARALVTQVSNSGSGF